MLNITKNQMTMSGTVQIWSASTNTKLLHSFYTVYLIVFVCLFVFIIITSTGNQKGQNYTFNFFT